MLIAALGFTVLGFGFLVAAVATGEIGWAWSCIGVGATGLLLLLVDLLRGRGMTDSQEQRPEECGGPGGDRPGDAEARADG